MITCYPSCAHIQHLDSDGSDICGAEDTNQDTHARWEYRVIIGCLMPYSDDQKNQDNDAGNVGYFSLLSSLDLCYS